MDMVEVLRRNGGVAETRTLRIAGVHSGQISQTLDAAMARRVRRGWYALPDADPLLVAEMAWHGTRTCITAARALGLAVVSDDRRIHLAFPTGRSFGGRILRPPADIAVHYFGMQRGSGVADAVDTCARCLPRELQLVTLDSALNSRGLLPTDIRQFTATNDRRRRWLARHCDAQSQSPLETLIRLDLRTSGLRVAPQVWIPNVGRVDFLVNSRVIVELDGRDYHSDPRTFADDRRRDRAAQLAGYVVLRYTYRDVMARREQLVAEVAAASGHAQLRIADSSPLVRSAGRSRNA